MKLKSILLCLIITFSAVQAQELDVRVKVRKDVLTPSQRDYLEGFETIVQNYMNDFRWTDFDYRGDKISVAMEINFASATDSKDYSAQVVIVSNRRIYEDDKPTERTSILLRLNDPKWSFNYIQGTPIYHNEFQFNQIASFLDFYAYLIIGTDFDSFEPLLGSTYFQKALVISQRAQGSSSANEWAGDQGKYSRANLLTELLNAQYEPFRTGLYLYFYEGLDYLKTEQSEAQKSIAKALNDLSEILLRTNAKSILLTMFLETKSTEICNALDGYPNRPAVMRNLMQADPARSEAYRRCSF